VIVTKARIAKDTLLLLLDPILAGVLHYSLVLHELCVAYLTFGCSYYNFIANLEASIATLRSWIWTLWYFSQRDVCKQSFIIILGINIALIWWRHNLSKFFFHWIRSYLVASCSLSLDQPTVSACVAGRNATSTLGHLVFEPSKLIFIRVTVWSRNLAKLWCDKLTSWVSAVHTVSKTLILASQKALRLLEHLHLVLLLSNVLCVAQLLLLLRIDRCGCRLHIHLKLVCCYFSLLFSLVAKELLLAYHILNYSLISTVASGVWSTFLSSMQKADGLLGVWTVQLLGQQLVETNSSFLSFKILLIQNWANHKVLSFERVWRQLLMAVRIVLRSKLWRLLGGAVELFAKIALLGLGHQLVVSVHQLALEMGILLRKASKKHIIRGCIDVLGWQTSVIAR